MDSTRRTHTPQATLGDHGYNELQNTRSRFSSWRDFAFVARVIKVGTRHCPQSPLDPIETYMGKPIASLR